MRFNTQQYGETGRGHGAGGIQLPDQRPGPPPLAQRLLLATLDAAALVAQAPPGLRRVMHVSGRRGREEWASTDTYTVHVSDVPRRVTCM